MHFNLKIIPSVTNFNVSFISIRDKNADIVGQKSNLGRVAPSTLNSIN